MQDIFNSLGLVRTHETTGGGDYPSRFAVSDLAENAIGAIGAALGDLLATPLYAEAAPGPSAITPLVDRRLASLWFGISIEPIGWELPPAWDAIAGDYETRDGWIKLHTNLPHHRRAACAALGLKPETAGKDAVARILKTAQKDTIETAIVGEGGVAAAMRSQDEWAVHQQGAAVASEPLIDWRRSRRISRQEWPAHAERPLEGVKVLDVTRVLAGPVATRTLAAFGAQVLRIDPPGWDEQIVIPEVTLGKHCARLDLKSAQGRDTFKALLAEADIFVHGLRPGALDALGFGADERRTVNQDLIDVSLNAYGWTGPWSARRGFDSLVQMSSGIAEAGMIWACADRPTPLPVQALDFATGYLMAAAAVKALSNRARGLPVADARLSLARTALLLTKSRQPSPNGVTITGPEAADWSETVEETGWGPAKRLKPPLGVGPAPMRWNKAAGPLGSSPARWP